uniref:Integral membrane bound transporter domain-containing protein n=1 Tax=Trypanosoma congolense (strain IL3000) TaxID=1068625 RepID=G0UUL3_TRYCI|nr:conserved hypothetical protein [Trypanosoma congolense IL3000]
MFSVVFFFCFVLWTLCKVFSFLLSCGGVKEKKTSHLQAISMSSDNNGGVSASKEPSVGLAGHPAREAASPSPARGGCPEPTAEHIGTLNDSFGLPLYVPQHASNNSGINSSLSVPWSLRKYNDEKKVQTFGFLSSFRFWRQVEFALRISLLAVFPAAGLAVGVIPLNILSSTTSALSSIVLSSKITVGEMFAFLFTWMRAGCIWLPLATIGVLIGVGNNIAGWCVYYTLILFIIATFTENMVRRVCLLLFNICMIGLLVQPENSLTFPSRVMADWCVGTALCALAVFIPYPIFSSTRAQGALKEIACCTGAAFAGMTSCFWSPSIVERNMAMTKVRVLLSTIDEMMHKFHTEQEHSFYEFLFDSGEARRTRSFKVQLFERLRTNLSGLSHVLDMVEGRPWVIDESERSLAFGERLSPHIKNVAMCVEKSMGPLASALTINAVNDLDPLFSEINEATRKLQHEFNDARLNLFYEHRPQSLEEFVPLMTFFMFTIINSHDTISQFGIDTAKADNTHGSSVGVIVSKVVLEPIMEDIEYILKLFRGFRRREIQRLIEAAKVSAAMIITVGFSFLIKVDMESLSGPSIIAFVSGSNPVEAVQASVVRLTACILGTVLGFFAGTYSVSPAEKIISLCILMFVGTFFRIDKDYGVMCVYAMFVLIPLNMNNSSTEDTLSRMNQITFGILIYIIISAVVFPLSPSNILRKKRVNILLRFREALTKLCNLFKEPLALEGRRDGSCYGPSTSPLGEDGAKTNSSITKTLCLSFSERLIASTDTCMEEIDALLNETTRRLKRTLPFMGFAREERGLLSVSYPTKACERTTFYLNRMLGLLRTMWCSWSVLRSQKMYTSETRHILATLHPIATDACYSFCKFVDLICYSLRNPTAALQTELMRAVLDFTQSVEELCLRKDHIMIAVITKSVNERFEGKSSNHDRGRGVSSTNNVRPSSAEGAVTTGPRGSALPLLRKKTINSIDSIGISHGNLVSLSDNFVMPISGEDAEGLHALTLSLCMFSNDTKLLLMNLEEMLDHIRKTL